MLLGRRDFLKWTGVAAAGTAAAPVAACTKPPATQPPTPPDTELMKVGLYSWNEIGFLGDQLKWLGLSYVRIGGVMSDALMTFCAQQNLEVLLNVSPAAERASFDNDAAFIDAYLAQIDAAVGTYGPEGTFWRDNPAVPKKPVAQIEVCNEPNFGYGFTGVAPETAALYAQVLIAAYDRIKLRAPAMTVVGFATGGASNAAPAFVSDTLNALRAANRLNCFDVMSVHPYSSNLPPEMTITEQWGTWVASESMDDVKQLMQDFAIDKPLWITEVGYQIPFADGGKFADPVHNGFGVPETVTPMQQAAYTVRMNMAAARHDISRVYHMSAMDTDNYNGGWFGFAAGHDPRPVAVAMHQVIKLLRGTTYLEVVLDGGTASPESPFAYRLTTPRGKVMVAWCQQPGRFKLPLDPDRETVVTDMLGKTLAKVTSDQYSTDLSEVPIFLHAAAEVQ